MSKKSPSLAKILGWSEDQCRDYLEARRWPNGPVCPKCGGVEPYKVTRRTGTKNKLRSFYKCRECKRQFTVTVGTVFERSHVSLRLWLAAIVEVCSDKKGIAAHELHRKLGVDYKTAWHMLHRLREAMRPVGERPKLSGTVEADATYVGGRYRRGAPAYHERIRDEIEMGIRNKDGSLKQGKGLAGKPHPRTQKAVVFGISERGGEVRAMVVKDEAAKYVQPLMADNIDLPNTRLMSDGHSSYRRIKHLGPHEVVDHSLEYVRDGDVHVQGIESFWSLLKRGVQGTYHHLSHEYLDRYVDEFTWRHNRRGLSDGERLDALMGQLDGRLRLTELRDRAHAPTRRSLRRTTGDAN